MRSEDKAAALILVAGILVIFIFFMAECQRAPEYYPQCTLI